MFSQYLPQQLNDFGSNVFFGNTVKGYLTALIIFIVFLIIFKMLYKVILKKFAKASEKTKTDIDDGLVRVFSSIKPPFYYFLAFYFAIRVLSINEFALKAIIAVLVIWITYLVINSVQVAIEFTARKITKEKDVDSKPAVSMISLITKILLWTLGFMLLLSNLGVNITSLIAGLGIGGVAVALALQNILTDLFSSFAIYFDKPFKIGDFIIVGDKMGVVKKIGIKTTRVQALQGEELIFSNRELTSVTIQNFKRMQSRRVQFNFGILYETPVDKVKLIPESVKKIILAIKDTRFDRCHFKEFGDSSLNFEVAYYVDSSDYNVYMDIQQEINIKIMEEFNACKIGFAYPTTTVYIKNT